jgi:hypothetical protein
MTEIRTPLWLFDGDCGPCDRAAARIRTRVAPPADVRPYQSADLDALGIGQDEVLRGPVLVRPDGSHVVGPQSVAELLRMSRPPFRLAGAPPNCYGCPGRRSGWPARSCKPPGSATHSRPSGRACTSTGTAFPEPRPRARPPNPCTRRAEPADRGPLPRGERPQPPGGSLASGSHSPVAPWSQPPMRERAVRPFPGAVLRAYGGDGSAVVATTESRGPKEQS